MELKHSSGIIIFFDHYLNHFQPRPSYTGLSCRDVRVHQAHVSDADSKPFLQLGNIILGAKNQGRREGDGVLFFKIHSICTGSAIFFSKKWHPQEWAALPHTKKNIPFLYFNTFLLTGKGNPLPYSCLENPMDGGAW